MLKFLWSTADQPVLYWLIGSLLIWLPLPANVLDIMIAPNWHAPHWQCDSLGVPIYQAFYFALPWAGISMLGAALLVVPMGWKRRGGEFIFRLKLGKPMWNMVISLPLVLACLFLVFPIFQHVWDAVALQTITVDCNGRAEPITISRRGPAIQITPFLGLCLALWLLHLRVLALSGRKG